MDPEIQLNRFAYHYVDPQAAEPLFAAREQDVASLPEEIRAFLLSLAAEVWDAPDAGSTRSARFKFSDQEEAERQEARHLIEVALEGGDDFINVTCQLAELLHRQSPQTASAGLLGVMRLWDANNDQAYLALVKIRYRDEGFIRLSGDGLPELAIEQVERILLKDVQKGALYPHPDKPAYDLKIVDSQARDDPAAYFTEKFLGCDSKKSDDLQIKKLTPTLERYAQERDLPIVLDKVSQVISDLRQKNENISAGVLAEVVEEKQLFGTEFAAEDFQEFLEQSDLGKLDIPAEEFQHKRRSSRRLVYRFLDPEYEGLEISGPPEAFRQVLSSKGGEVVFEVRVTPDGFEFSYR